MTKKEQQRADRYEHREELKLQANRQGSEAAEHPQVRRQIEDARLQIKELQAEPETA